MAQAFFEPGLPWTAASTDVLPLSIDRRTTHTVIRVNPVMPGHPILVETSANGGESDMAGTITLFETTGGPETNLGTKAVEVEQGYRSGCADFTLPDGPRARTPSRLAIQGRRRCMSPQRPRPRSRWVTRSASVEDR